MSNPQSTREATLEALRQRALEKQKQGATPAPVVKAEGTPGVGRKKKETVDPTQKAELERQDMICLMCGVSTKRRMQRWFAEHLVNAHRMTLGDYIEAFYEPREDFKALVSAPVSTVLPPIARENLKKKIEEDTVEENAGPSDIDSPVETETVSGVEEALETPVISEETPVLVAEEVGNNDTSNIEDTSNSEEVLGDTQVPLENEIALENVEETNTEEKEIVDNNPKANKSNKDKQKDKKRATVDTDDIFDV